MKKLTVVVLALSLFAAACGDDDAASDPASIDTCEGVADATIVMMQDVIDVIGALEPMELAGLMDGEQPEAFDALEETATVLGQKTEELGCTDLGDLLAERADQLEAAPDNAIGQMIVGGIQAGEDDVLGRLFR